MTVPFREARIELDAISDNVRHFRRLTGVEVIAVVKANAYGHGAAAGPAPLSGNRARTRHPPPLRRTAHPSD